MPYRGAHISYRKIHPRSGRRADICDHKGKTPHKAGLFLRSQMEANVARMFQWFQCQLGLIQSWKYEPPAFMFTEFGYKRGPFSYRVDFEVQWTSRGLNARPDGVFLNSGIEFFEIKGKETGTDRSKWARMRKHYPDVPLTVIDAAHYRDLIAKWGSSIPHWEGKAKRR